MIFVASTFLLCNKNVNSLFVSMLNPHTCRSTKTCKFFILYNKIITKLQKRGKNKDK